MKKLRKLYLFFLIIFFNSISISAQEIDTTILSNRVVEYRIDANLDPETKIITAKMRMSWINTSTDTLSELQFHTYMNAFKNTASTFMKESGGQSRGNFIKVADSNSWGWIEISKFRDQFGNNLLGKINFIQPDDNNPEDNTVFSVRLPSKIRPGEKMELDFEFQVKLPRVFARSGFSENFFMVGQWFPKIGVFEKNEKGNWAWNCHQYHSNSEFYADFGVYKVNITLPQKYVVGATGELISEKNNTNGTKTLKFVAKDVIDFAWTASERYKVKEYEWKNVKIRILLQPEHLYLAERHRFATVTALEYFEKTLGKYPYNIITVVDPPTDAPGAGGMEYPMLITAGTFRRIPEGIRYTEMVVIHEFGHQYFMGIIASNEFEEAWLDEGINSYMETRIMDETYGPKNSLIDFFGLTIGDGEIQRSGYVHGGHAAISEVYKKSWEYSEGEYAVMSYNKPATFLNTVDNLIGRENMNKVMHTYYERFKFKHPKTQDFINIVNEVYSHELENKYGENMNWFFDQVLYSTSTCDYEVYSISNHKLAGFAGSFGSGTTKSIKTADYSKNNFTSKVVLRRNGDFIMPVELLIEFDNGDNVVKTWDGKTRTKVFEFKGSEQIVSVKIDPYNKITLDTNFINNSKTVEPQRTGIYKYVLKFLFRLQNLLQLISFFA
jgi:hypothetical protein